MIRVSVDPAALWMKAKGHADYAPAGSDIVCAASSILVATVAKCMQEWLRDEEINQFRVELGDVLLQVSPREADMRKNCSAVYRAALEGFKLLAAQYPECVTVE